MVDTEGTYTGNLVNEHYFSGNSVAGAFGQGLNFDDVLDSAEHRSAGNLLGAAYSWSLWVKGAFDTSGSPLGSPPDPPEGVFGFSMASGKTLWRNAAFHKLTNDDVVGAQLTSTLSTTDWNHVAGTWDGTNLKLYYNGTLEATSAAGNLAA